MMLRWSFCWVVQWMTLVFSFVSLAGTGEVILPLLPPNPPSGNTGFQRMEPTITGLTFAHTILPARHLTNQMLLDGSGVALADADGDGLVDVFLGASGGASQLWRNQGNWRFEDVTDKAFPNRANLLSGDVTGCAFADLNGDRASDLVLNTHAAGIRVLLNTGKGVFHPVPFPQVPARGGHSLALADVDGDGWVDLYVCNYRERALMDMPSARATFQGSGARRMVATLDGRPTTDPDLTNRFVVSAEGGIDELGEPDVLYRSLGGTNFLDIPWTGGAFVDEDNRSLKVPQRDWGLAAQFCDVNGDGRPDLYVCNDFQTPDRFWLNESSPGNVRFRLISPSALRHTSLFSMGVDFADVNRDDRWDFIVLDMLSPDHVRRLTMLDGTPSAPVNSGDPSSRPQVDANTLFLQRFDGSFAEVASLAGVTATDWSWTPAFVDVDLDGWPDLLISAGQERGSRDLDVADYMKAFRRAGLRTDAQIFRERQKFPPQRAPLRAYRNLGVSDFDSVPRFADLSKEWGFDFEGVSHGLALGDLDGDGDLDVVVNHLNSPVGLYRNTSATPRVSMRLKGQPPNTDAIGAQLRFWWSPNPSATAVQRSQSAQVMSGGRYLSSDAPQRTFACLGPGQGTLEIRWPRGRVTMLTNLLANRHYDIDESTATDRPISVSETPKVPRPRFEAVTTPLRCAGSMADDFGIQPLLPRRQSTRTPALLYRTNSIGGQLWMAAGPAQPLREATLAGLKLESVREIGAVAGGTALVAWKDGVIVAREAGARRATEGSQVSRLDIHSGRVVPVATSVLAPSLLAAVGPSAAHTGWLFVGGGAVPGEYPRSSLSEILEAEGDSFRSLVITNLGLITAAGFWDIDKDDSPELVTVSDWGSPRIFRNQGKDWIGWDPEIKTGEPRSLRLSDLTGWWQSVAVGDFDLDGRPDVVLGNWGLNSAYAMYQGPPPTNATSLRPLRLYFGAVLDPNPGACLETYSSEDGREWPIHGKADLASRLPLVSARFPTHRAFAEVTVEGLLGERHASAEKRECRWLASLILFNRGDHFEARTLPDAAQLGPAMALATADFDGDGRLDMYVGQGFFGQNFGVRRDDAGEGVFLLGRRGETFEAVTTSETGVRILGEQRVALAEDLDGDGRVDLIIGEHGGPVTLLSNRTR
ncbi:MAG TPA: VCBS repeat-containing protein [Verrucomicrobiota bacterium]|nr:hypothetical protein [Verrucomicrobiales bacterium]HRI12357.1 VCBS repeat-containing protein [Verrucomicrobiota bacterium]